MHWLGRLITGEPREDSSDKGRSRISPFTVVWGLAIVGLLLLVGEGFRCNSAPRDAPVPVAAGGSHDDLGWWQDVISSRVAEILAHVAGAGEVRVTVHLDRGPESRPVRDEDVRQTVTEEQDAGGGTRVMTDTQTSWRVVGGSVNGTLTWEATTMPTVTAAVVVASGAHSPRVRAQLHQATATLLGLPSHRVVVLPGGGGGSGH